VDVIVLTYTLVYMVLILGDLLVEEFQCTCSLPLIREDVRLMQANCTAQLLSGNTFCLSVPWMEDKNTAALRLDFAFLLVFFCELTLRMFASGKSYFTDALNVADLIIIVASIALDLVVMLGVISGGFTLLRLGRLLRIARIVGTFQKVLARKRQIATKRSAVSTVLTPPTCNWKAATPKNAPRKSFACFLSHAKSESATDARYVHDLLQMCARVPRAHAPRAAALHATGRQSPSAAARDAAVAGFSESTFSSTASSCATFAASSSSCSTRSLSCSSPRPPCSTVRGCCWSCGRRPDTRCRSSSSSSRASRRAPRPHLLAGLRRSKTC
jgi:hypothetical protein